MFGLQERVQSHNRLEALVGCCGASAVPGVYLKRHNYFLKLGCDLQRSLLELDTQPLSQRELEIEQKDIGRLKIRHRWPQHLELKPQADVRILALAPDFEGLLWDPFTA